MPPDDKDNLTEGAKQLYRKTRVPHKFCPYCGNRNEPEAQMCAECGKDISWIKVPEPIPAEDKPFQRARKMPEQKKIFTPRAVIIFALILLILAALIVVLVVFTTKKSKADGIGIRTVETYVMRCPMAGEFAGACSQSGGCPGGAGCQSGGQCGDPEQCASRGCPSSEAGCRSGSSTGCPSSEAGCRSGSSTGCCR